MIIFNRKMRLFNVRLGLGPLSFNPASKNFFLSLNDLSDSVTDKSD